MTIEENKHQIFEIAKKTYSYYRSYSQLFQHTHLHDKKIEAALNWLSEAMEKNAEELISLGAQISSLKTPLGGHQIIISYKDNDVIDPQSGFILSEQFLSNYRNLF